MPYTNVQRGVVLQNMLYKADCSVAIWSKWQNHFICSTEGDSLESVSRAEDLATREDSFPSASRSYELATHKTSASSRAKDLVRQENYPSGLSGGYGLATQRFESVQPTSIQSTNDPSGVRSERQYTTQTAHSESAPGHSAYNLTTTLNERCASVVMYTSSENWRIDGSSI